MKNKINNITKMGMHTRWGSPGASKKLNLNKVLRNTIGPALVLAAWDQVAQAQSTNFTYTGNFHWTVPATGLYHITAFGAGGGGYYPGLGGSGFGAKIGGDFSLFSGQVLSIAVGSPGSGGYDGGGGGGGSFVTFFGTGNALVIAGGGGGDFGGRGGGGGNCGGGGGGSFNGGLNPINVAGFQSGNGLVEIVAVPTLGITKSAPGFVTLSWVPASTNWVLQENLALRTTNWVNSPSGTNNPVIVPTTQPAKFFRLLKH